MSSLRTNLVSYWKLDGNLNDAHGSNHGTLSLGTATYVTGKVGQAFDFDQASAVSAGTSSTLALSTTGAISAWIHPDDLGQSNLGRIFDRRSVSGGYVFYLSSTNKITFFNQDASPNTFLSTGIVNFNAWNHVGVTWSGVNGTFYLNGAAAGTFTMSALIVAAANTAMIGNTSVTLDRAFDGEIDELAIWSRHLSAAEWQQLYNGGNGLSYDSFAGGAMNAPIFGGMFSPTLSGI